MLGNILIFAGVVALGILWGIGVKNYFDNKNGGLISKDEFRKVESRLRGLELETQSKEFEYKKAVIHYEDGPSTKVDMFEDVERVSSFDDTVVVYHPDRRTIYDDARVIKVELIENA